MKKQLFRKMLKKCLVLLLCCGLIWGLAAPAVIGVYATGETASVAQVDGTVYDSYEAAWDAVKDGGTVTMMGNWEIGNVLTVSKGASVTVNMNGFMINRNLTSGKDSGEIFLVTNNATLILNGKCENDTVHWGTFSKNKWYYQGEGKGNYEVHGSLLTGGYNADGGGAIHIQENASVKIDSVTIAGNACSDSEKGGAIRVQGKNAKLELANSALLYNKSQSGGGAAIWVEGEDSQVTVSNSRICNNTVDVDYGDGGAIQINNGTVSLENSQLSFNEAGRNGGAVYIFNGNLSVDADTVFLRNVSNKEGGAIYVNSGADKVNVKGIFVGNYAAEEGGAIYVNSNVDGEKGLSISDVEMMGNNSMGNGGAIYVDPDDSINLSGKVVLHGNSPNNLYIKSADNIKNNALTEGSQIGIYTSWTANKENPIKTSNYSYFFSDKLGYELAGADSNFYYIEAEQGAGTDYTANGVTYPLEERVFSYTGMEGGTMSPQFYYSDGFFAEEPKFYNEHLASLAVSMALAAMTANFEGEYTEDKAAKNIVDMFVSMGFSDIFLHYPEPEFFGKDAENLSTIGYIIGKKTITLDGEQITLVATAVRGGGYGAEWASNVTLGSGLGEAQGFGDAARQVKEGIDSYLVKEGIDGENAKFFITGYSRAAATSNLVAKKLTDTYGEEQVYAYCFETPKGGVPSELKSGLLYTNIHNIVNRVDVVTTVGTTEMGFIRYGIDHIIPGNRVGSSSYKAQKERMLAQLQAVNPNIQHDDKFREASVEYIMSTLDAKNVATDLVDENWFPDFEYAEDWVPYFIEKLQQYALNDMLTDVSLSEEQMLTATYKNYTKNNIYNNKSTNWHGYRNFWADYEWYLYFDESNNNMVKNRCYAQVPPDFDNADYVVMSVEDAVAYLMNFYFGASEEEKEALIAAIDPATILDRVEEASIWFYLIGEWDNFSIGNRNTQFAELWNDIGLDEVFEGKVEGEELKQLKAAVYVVVDFLMDFVSDDYDSTDQDVLGTLLYNVGTIMQTHYQDVTCSWVRSYDSFYGDVEFVCNHTYGAAVILQAATETEYGVQKKVCSLCAAEAYEAIAPAVDSEVKDPAVGNDDATASLLGPGSIISIVCMSVALIACGVMVVLSVKNKKRSRSDATERIEK